MSARFGGAAGNSTANFALYIGNLAEDVNEALLFDIFSAVGPVSSTKVCRDSVSRRSLGYGYVNFHDSKDADRALAAMNFTHIRGKACRLMWAQKDKSIREAGIGNIVIKNLDTSIDNKTLFDTFSMFGDILSCKVGVDRVTGKSLGYGFVHYSSLEAAETAIDKVNGMVIAEKKVTVELYVEKSKRRENSESTFTNLYISQIPKSWPTEKIESLLGNFGEIQSVQIPPPTAAENSSDKNKGYGYCDFQTHESAVKALEEFSKQPECADVKLVRYMSKQEIKNVRKSVVSTSVQANLYIRNIPDDMGDDQLRELFAEHGEILSAKVMTFPSGKSRNFGFVHYKENESATKAIVNMHQKMCQGKSLFVCIAQPKAQRQEMLKKKFAMKKIPKAFPSVPAMNFAGPMNPYARAGPMMPPQMNPYARAGPMNMMTPYGMVSPMRNMRTSRPVPDRVPSGVVASGSISAAVLAGKTPAERKQFIGEELYKRIQELEPKKCGKITGMLLEMDQTECLTLLENRDELMKKVNEALYVLGTHGN